MANREGTRWRGKIPIPPHAHPLVREFIELMNEEKTTIKEIAARSRISPKTMSDWRYRSCPTLNNFEATLNALGYELCIREKKYPVVRNRENQEIAPL